MSVMRGGAYIYLEMNAERERAHAKHKDKPGGSMEGKPWDAPDWIPVIVEELGEVSRVVNDRRHDVIPTDIEAVQMLRAELIQTGAMAAAWIAAIDDWQP